MAKAILFLVSADAPVRQALESDLARRFAADYRVLSAHSRAVATDVLRGLATDSEEVAVLIAPERLEGAAGVDFLASAHDLHPRARRVLLIDRGTYGSAHPAARAMALGRIDHYLFNPWWFPLERWLYLPLAEVLAGWTASRAPIAEAASIVGQRWDPRTHDLAEVFARIAIPYRVHGVDSKSGRRILKLAGEDGSRLPVVRFHSGRSLVEPTHADLVESLGFPTTVEAEFSSCDVAVVGAGPAGLAAAVYAASEGLSTVVLESRVPGGQAGTSSMIRNYLGFPAGVSGDDLTNRALEQAWLFRSDFVIGREATGLRPRGTGRVLRLSDGSEVAARTVVIATGVTWRRLNVPSLEALVGSGVYYGAAGGEARALAGRPVFVVGAGNSAGQAAIHLARYAASVTMVVRGDSLGKTMSDYLVREIEAAPNVTVRLGSEVVEAAGSTHLQAITIRDREAGATETGPAAGLFVMIGAEPNTGWLAGTLKRDEEGFLLTGHDLAGAVETPEWPLRRSPFHLETSMPGVFAAGDVTHGSTKRVASAVGAGATAIQLIHAYLLETSRPEAGAGR
ncbi:MAG: FAD-dependent oxidoreductase [Candidatus Dormibacteraeota bacterium]|nr:FAD-dependent oxidoreductase [Candidatus Dormibacteraeota bacterium]